MRGFFPELYFHGLSKVLLLVAVVGCRSIQPRQPTTPSLDCLEARERDPTAPCDDLLPQNGRNVRVIFNVSQVEPEKQTDEQKVVVKFSLNQSHSVEGISLYNYPNYQDPKCQSSGEFFCDPYGYLSPAERQNISGELAKLRAEHLVICEDLVREPIDQRHLAPFYVGLAIAEAEKDSQMLGTSLKQYGHLIMSEWSIDSFFADPPNGVSHCPNKALLLVLPRNGQAMLVTDGCRHLCEETSKTGALVATNLKDHSVAKAVLLGVRDAYASLPRTVQQGEDMPGAAPVQVPPEASGNAESWVLFVQRAVFAFAVVALGLSFAVGFLVMCFAEGLVKGRRL